MNVIRHKKQQIMVVDDHNQLDETIQIIKFNENTCF
jgi:hypothetical protein